MSSNAFARSRPRNRQQRMPRGSSSYDHPRFLQLINELARINDLKRKQEEAVSSGPSSSGCSINDCNEDDSGGSPNGGEGTGFSSYQAATTSICCDVPTLNGYRSLESNQPALALQDNYHQQQQQQHQSHLHHHHHQHESNLHQHHLSLEHHHHQQQTHQQPNYIQHNHHLQHPSHSQSMSNSSLQQHRCQVGSEQNISKSTSSGFGYSKQNLVVEQQQQHHSSDVSTNHLDHRQDENRSKRKRIGIDSSATSSLASSTSSAVNSRKLASGAATSKRHKSSSDTVRPLSPSFTKCPICLLDCMDRDPSFTNTCFHLFCYVCIEHWTKNKTSCPLCRTKFTKIIFNIKSATVYDEKIASPIRRDDDDGYIADRLMMEHLPGLNSSSTVSNRNANSDDVQFLFENLRNNEVIIPPYFVNQLDARQGESLHSFNTVTATTNFNSNVPHPQFTPTSYPLTPNYIALFPPGRIAQPTTTTAIASAYGANTSLTSNLNNNDTSGNRRTSRSGRYIYTRNYDFPSHDGPTTRVPRNANSATTVTLPGVAEVRHHQHHHHHQHHQHQQQHPSHHHQHHHHNNQHRSTLDMSSSSTPSQQSQHAHIPLTYPYPPNSYPRRPFNSSQVEQQLLDNLYRNMPDI